MIFSALLCCKNDSVKVPGATKSEAHVIQQMTTNGTGIWPGQIVPNIYTLVDPETK